MGIKEQGLGWKEDLLKRKFFKWSYTSELYQEIVWLLEAIN